MDTALRDFAPHITALLLGGLAGSIGLSFAARTPRARALLAGPGGWVALLGTVVLALLGGVAAFVQARTVLSDPSGGLSALRPGQLLVFGLLVGLPLSLPGLVFAWSEARGAGRRAKRNFVPTKDDRRKFAADLAVQIREVSPRSRDVSASVGGDGGRVLRLEGDIDAQEGERLTAALRTDLSELGFKRVEGTNGSNEWWSRVPTSGGTK